MVSAASHAESLRLPVLIYLPAVPGDVAEIGRFYMGLGLGDFFFAGLIGVQTLKKFGKHFAVSSVMAMAISFFIFQTVMLTYGIFAFPGTLMIICGWLPLVLWKKIKR
jgi:hypothetical protein